MPDVPHAAEIDAPNLIADECRDRCAYGVCRKTMSDPYGCGGCCSCLGGCQVIYEKHLGVAVDSTCDGCVCPSEHDGDYGSSGHAGPCPPHTCGTRVIPPGLPDSSEAPVYPARHGFTPGKFSGGCRVMLARYPCNYTPAEHDPELPPEDLDHFGYRRDRFTTPDPSEAEGA